MVYTLYVLKSETAVKSYVGITDNLERRLKEHNSGKHLYTKRYVPWRVIYKETFDSFEEVRAREVYFKSATGRRHLKKIFDRIGE